MEVVWLALCKYGSCELLSINKTQSKVATLRSVFFLERVQCVSKHFIILAIPQGVKTPASPFHLGNTRKAQ